MKQQIWEILSVSHTREPLISSTEGGSEARDNHLAHITLPQKSGRAKHFITKGLKIGLGIIYWEQDLANSPFAAKNKNKKYNLKCPVAGMNHSRGCWDESQLRSITSHSPSLPALGGTAPELLPIWECEGQVPRAQLRTTLKGSQGVGWHFAAQFLPLPSLTSCLSLWGLTMTVLPGTSSGNIHPLESYLQRTQALGNLILPPCLGCNKELYWGITDMQLSYL